MITGWIRGLLTSEANATFHKPINGVSYELLRARVKRWQVELVELWVIR